MGKIDFPMEKKDCHETNEKGHFAHIVSGIWLNLETILRIEPLFVVLTSTTPQLFNKISDT